MSEANMEMAKTVYESICVVLDSMNIKYKRVDDDLVLLISHRGEDMNHDLIFIVNAEKEVIQMYEKLPFGIDEDRVSDVARAICLVNNTLLLGGFNFNLNDSITYEITQLFSGSLIGEDTIRKMMLALVFTVEEYDDKFMALNKGYLKPEDFLK